MSTSPGAAQAAADNQMFWTGIAKLPEEAQRSFWDAGTTLSGYIGESTAPRVLTYDTSSPPPGIPWYERIFFYIGQSSINQGVTAQAQSRAITEGAGWLWGALQGDFNKSPTRGQIITGGIISLIPIVDQVCDVRDIVANCLNLSDPKARDDPENWVALGLTCIGFVPLFGSAIKTVGKVALKHSHRLIDLLKQMEWLEKHRQSLKITIPWGHAPIDWLKKYDWQAALSEGAARAKAAFLKAKQRALDAAKYGYGAVEAKLKQLADLFHAIAHKIADVMADLGKRIKDKIDRLLGNEKKEAGNFGAAPGGPNKHGQGDKKPPEGSNKPPSTKLSRAERLEDLARDPAQGGKVTAKTRREAEVGLSLEEQGKLPGPITREPTGSAEFVDAKGQKWDVKGFNSQYAPKGYNTEDAVAKIRQEVAAGENVIVDTAKMAEEHIADLERALSSAGLSSHVIFF